MIHGQKNIKRSVCLEVGGELLLIHIYTINFPDLP